MAVEQLITENIDLWTSSIKSKATTGRGSSKKIDLHGIKKLRELILELAVRGKLVPQNPSDEPASELLKRIAEEKAQLVADKKIKKAKTLPEITDEEKLFELPEGWEWERLGKIVSIVRGITFPASEKSKEDAAGRVACLRTTNVQEQTEWDDLLFVDSKFVKRDEQYLQINDILMSMANSRELVGKVSFVNSIPVAASSFGGFLSVIRPYEIAPYYIMTALRSPQTRNSLIGSASQTTNIANISLEKLNPLPVAIPPLKEQHRIVTKVDELMALCDQLEQQSEASVDAHQQLAATLLDSLTNATSSQELTDNWQRVQDNFDLLITDNIQGQRALDQLKQTILQLAVMGKLVPQDSTDEPASALLERIAEEKAQLIKDKKIKKQKPLPSISDDEKPFDLPEGWEWCKLQSLISLMDAGWSPACPPEPSPSDDKWGVLKTTAVQSMEYWGHENKVLADTKEPRPQYEVKSGDILITRAGPKNRVGVSCLVQSTRPKLMISDKIIRFHLAEVGMCERYISLCLNAGATAEFLERSKSGMAESQMNISQDKLKVAPIPLCPIDEQERIVAKVDQLMALCDQLKDRLATAQQTQNHLADALVERALDA